MTEAFDFTDYRVYLKKVFQEQKKRGWGSITQWTDAIRCQRSHGSRVMSGDKDLSPEQALATAQFLGLGDAETDFFILLTEYGGAGSKSYKDRLYGKIRRLQTEREDLAKLLEKDRLGTGEKENLYYSTWYWSAVHILVSIPGYQTVAKISEKLSLPQNLTESILLRLESFGLVRREKGKWLFASGSLHLPKNSPMFSMHHQNWHQRATLDTQVPNSEGLHYTVVQSLSKSDFEKFKAQLLKLIEDYNRIAGPSESEELINFSCDFFKV